MRKLDGYDNTKFASNENPISEKQNVILAALSYYFDYNYGADCKNADDAYDVIHEFKDRIDISKDQIFIDGWLIYNENGIHPYAHKFSDIPEEFADDFAEDYYDEYDPTDMSTWDDDDWINFELDH